VPLYRSFLGHGEGDLWADAVMTRTCGEGDVEDESGAKTERSEYSPFPFVAWYFACASLSIQRGHGDYFEAVRTSLCVWSYSKPSGLGQIGRYTTCEVDWKSRG
jgi:hypothetical protein